MRQQLQQRVVVEWPGAAGARSSQEDEQVPCQLPVAGYRQQGPVGAPASEQCKGRR